MQRKMYGSLAFCLLCFVCLLPVLVFAQSSDPDIETEYLFEIPGDQQKITSIAHAGDARLFISSLAGRTYIYENEVLHPTPFLDLSSVIYERLEGGFLRLVFHPDYANNGYFFVNYTYEHASLDMVTRVSRFQVNADDPNLADPDSELILLEFAQPAHNHNGGDMHFGNDSYLYIATGDGGWDSAESQDTETLLGNILRLDVDGGGVAGNCGLVANYNVPDDNPFVAQNADCNAIWVYGLRNPWRFAIDPFTDGIWIADVGDNDWEEINYLPAGSSGLNFGWPCFEGNEPRPDCNSIEHTRPVHVEAHQQDSFHCSITGGFVYRGSQMDNLQGHYILADWCAGDYKALGGDPENPSITLFPNILGGPITFGEDNQGEIYIANGGGIARMYDTNPSKIATSVTLKQVNSHSTEFPIYLALLFVGLLSLWKFRPKSH